jgi:glycosyltransferase involved in cell wall biosynthesis
MAAATSHAIQDDNTMRVLLNSTKEEMDQLGGDFTHYRDWQQLCADKLDFCLVPSGKVRRGSVLARKALEKLCGTWQPAWFRRRILLWSRLVWVAPKTARGADLIFSHVLFPWVKRNRTPVVWNSQGISPAQYYDTYNRGQWTVEDVAYLYRELGKKADALVILTNSCARNVVAWCPELEEKVYVVPAPVFVDAAQAEASEKPSLRDGTIRALFTGIDAERKGLPEVVKAFRSVRERFSNVQLDIVSRPSAELQKEIATLKDVRLHISSPRVDVKALMRQSDIFLLPTHADTYALAAVEAMAHGCAVIVSDLQPLPEIIPEGDVGFNVPIGDADTLAKKFARLVEDKDLLRTFQGNALRRFRSLHSPEVVGSRLEEVFSQVLNRRAQQPSLDSTGMSASSRAKP